MGKSDQDVIRRYTYEECARLLESEPTPSYSWVGWGASHAKEWDNWAGGSWESCHKLFLNGWDEPVARIKAEALSHIGESRRPLAVHDVAGSDVDMPLFMQGIPECMVEVVRTVRPSPVVKIFINRSASSNINKSRLVTVGVNVLTLVEGLRLAGIPSEIWAGFVTSAWGTYQTSVRVQEAGRPIDISRLAFWAAHPGALRRILFALCEHDTAAVRRQFDFSPRGGGTGSYSHPIDYPLDAEEWDEITPMGNVSDSRLAEWVNGILTRRVGEGRIA